MLYNWLSRLMLHEVHGERSDLDWKSGHWNIVIMGKELFAMTQKLIASGRRTSEIAFVLLIMRRVRSWKTLCNVKAELKANIGNIFTDLNKETFGMAFDSEFACTAWLKKPDVCVKKFSISNYVHIIPVNIYKKERCQCIFIFHKFW